MKIKKFIYWLATGLLCLMMLGSAGMYILNHAEVAKIFNALNYPTYIIYPLAMAKILGVTAILTKYSNFLKYLAYAGFFYDFLLAASAHYFAGVPSPFLAITALILLIASFVLDRKLYN